MRKTTYIIAIVVFAIFITAITWIYQNRIARKWGGTVEIKLPANTKLVTTTWKDDHLWYLTRPMRTDEQPEEYKFQEDSAFGILEGTVVIKEKRETNSK